MCTLKAPIITLVYALCKVQDVEKKGKESEARARSFVVQGIKERRMAVSLLIAAKECFRQKEMKAKGEGEPPDGMEASLKAETLRVLERQEKFLNGFDAGDPVEIAPGHTVTFRKTR